MTRLFHVSVCLVALLSTGGALAQAAAAQTDENASEATSTAVAHVYVGSGSQTLAFSAAANGKLEIAQQMANHESSRTTGLYDRRDDQVSLDEIERIVI